MPLCSACDKAEVERGAFLALSGIEVKSVRDLYYAAKKFFDENDLRGRTFADIGAAIYGEKNEKVIKARGER